MKKHNRSNVRLFGLLSIIFLVASVFSGCKTFQPSHVEAHFKTANSEISMNLNGSGPDFNNSVNKLLVNTKTITDSTRSASDVAIILMQSKNIKDNDVEVNVVKITDGRYGGNGYRGHRVGSKEELADKEIDALTKYNNSVLKENNE